MRYKQKSAFLNAMMVSVTIWVVALPSIAYGQETGGLEDIVVTARKRAESTQDVPVALTAISAQQIERYDLTSLEKVSASTPQFTIGRAASGSGATLVLRGIGSNSTSIGIEQSVAIVVDGVYYGQGRVINEGFFDLERVEILKGPQALFFGKNATAGVVSLTSANPGSTPEYRLRTGYEFRSQELYGEAVLSQPLSDTLGLRIALRASKMWGGYLKNKADVPFTYTTTDVVTGAVTNHAELPSARNDPKLREFIGRVTLRWEPTSALTATLKASANINDQNNAAFNYALYRCPGGVSQLNPLVQCGDKFQHYQNRYPADIAAVTPHASNQGDLGNRYRSWSTTATIEYDLGNVGLTSVTNYNWNKNRFQSDGDFVTNKNGSFPTEITSFNAFSSEIRALTSFDGPINLMIGGYYQKTKRKYDIWTITGGVENSAAPDGFRYLSTTKDSETKGETIAAFGQVTWKIVPRIELAAGVRYTHETKDSYFIHPYSHPTLVGLGRFLPNVRIEADQTFNNWSPEATITYKPVDEITIYGGYKTAYKSGGFSNSGILSPSASVNDFAFGPEKARGCPSSEHSAQLAA
jgi:outer membrane receptor protein involved in Fe transport